MPLQLGAADGQRRQAVVAGLDRRAHRRAAARPRGRPGGARIDSSPSSVHTPAGLPGEPAGQQPQQRAGVADVEPAAGGLERARAGRRRGSPRAVAVLVDAGPERQQRRRASSACPRSRGSCGSSPARRSSRRTARRGARSTCPAGGVSSPRSGPEGSKRALRQRPRSDGEAELADQLARRASAASSPAIHSVIAPERLSGAGRQRHVHDVHPRPAQRQRHLRRRYPGGSAPSRAARGRRRPRGRPPAGGGGRPRAASFQASIAVGVAGAEQPGRLLRAARRPRRPRRRSPRALAM